MREAVENLRRQGRTYVDPEIALSPPQTQKRTSKDIWDHVVAAAIESRQTKIKRMSGKHIASQIAGKIQMYWDAQVAKQEKARVFEEKRLRMLAKATIRMVTTEWKKAVFVSCYMSCITLPREFTCPDSTFGSKNA